MSLALGLQELGLDAAIASFEDLSVADEFEMLDTIGRLVQLQTKRRIETEKTSPNGVAWKATERSNPLLYASGALHDSIDFRTGLGEVMIGSPLPYAAPHQFGAEIKPKNSGKLVFKIGTSTIFADKVDIPARPYMGVSADNALEIESVISDLLAEIMQ